MKPHTLIRELTTRAKGQGDKINKGYQRKKPSPTIRGKGGTLASQRGETFASLHGERIRDTSKWKR